MTTSSPSRRNDADLRPPGNDHDQDALTSPFVTTSDVMKQLNTHLANLSSPDEDDSLKPRFELQKRLPNGSAIPASSDEIAANDFKTKLEQCAIFVSQLATPDDRQHWAEQQRQMGNAFFGRGDYKGAMDIYLTCLVVKENTPGFVNHTLFPVLNNLAQCTMQLGMRKTTILFCDMALKEASQINELVAADEDDTDTNKPSADDFDDGGSNDFIVNPIAMCKLHFKKAKALRLTGDYVPARASLNASLDQLEKKMQEMASNDNDTTIRAEENTTSLEPYQHAIQKEFRNLDAAEKEARKNRQRQKRAMQKVLSSPNPSQSTQASKATEASAIMPSTSLYADLSTDTKPRQYSTLRARKNVGKDITTPESIRVSQQTNRKQQNATSYTQYYWNMVARVATFLLHLLGDDAGSERADDQKSIQTRDSPNQT